MLDDASEGVRLAWVCLLCFAKSQGRAGKVRLRSKAFASQYRLKMDDVEEMLVRAAKAEAVARQNDEASVRNWKRYQDPRIRTSSGTEKANEADHGSLDTHSTEANGSHFTKTSENDATHHQAHITHHPSPSTKHKNAPAAVAAREPDGFGAFWSAYPRKVGKQAAEKAFRSALKRTDAATLVEAATAFAQSEKGRAGEFCPHPSTWLNAGRWLDDRSTWNGGGQARGSPSASEGLDFSKVLAMDGAR